MELGQRITTVLPQMKVRKRFRLTTSLKALSGNPLATCFTKTGLVAKDVHWHPPCLPPEATKEAVQKVSPNRLAAVKELRECLLDKRIPTCNQVLHTAFAALHVCITQNRPVRREVAIGAFKLLARFCTLRSEPWGIGFKIHRHSYMLERLGFLGLGPVFETDFFTMYVDAIESNGPYATKELTAVALNLLITDLSPFRVEPLDMGRFIESNEPSLAAILGMALTCIANGVPERRVGSLGPWGTDSAMLVINQHGVKLEIDFKGNEFAAINMGPKSSPWTFDYREFSSLCATLLSNTELAAANGPIVSCTLIEEGKRLQINTPKGICRTNLQKFKDLQLTLTDALESDLMRRWIRYNEFYKGVF